MRLAARWHRDGRRRVRPGVHACRRPIRRHGHRLACMPMRRRYRRGGFERFARHLARFPWHSKRFPKHFLRLRKRRLRMIGTYMSVAQSEDCDDRAARRARFFQLQADEPLAFAL